MPLPPPPRGSAYSLTQLQMADNFVPSYYSGAFPVLCDLQLDSKGNHSATSKLVHWPSMGGLLHLVQRGWPGRAVAPPSPLLAVPNVTAHPSTASVLITVLLYDGALLCDFNVAIKGLSTRPKAGTLCDGAVCLICLFICRPTRVSHMFPQPWKT